VQSSGTPDHGFFLHAEAKSLLLREKKPGDAISSLLFRRFFFRFARRLATRRRQLRGNGVTWKGTPPDSRRAYCLSGLGHLSTIGRGRDGYMLSDRDRRTYDRWRNSGFLIPVAIDCFAQSFRYLVLKKCLLHYMQKEKVSVSCPISVKGRPFRAKPRTNTPAPSAKPAARSMSNITSLRESSTVYSASITQGDYDFLGDDR